jgi:hypothetical protein
MAGPDGWPGRRMAPRCREVHWGVRWHGWQARGPVRSVAPGEHSRRLHQPGGRSRAWQAACSSRRLVLQPPSLPPAAPPVPHLTMAFAPAGALPGQARLAGGGDTTSASATSSSSSSADW